MKLIHQLNGRINQDANPEYINSKDGEVLERRNARVTTIGNNRINVSLKGMQSIGTTTGLGTVVGFTEDKKRKWGIAFYKDSSVGHIYAYSTDTETVIKILDVPFAFGDHIEARVINDTLIWTDNVNPIRQINIIRAVNYTNAFAGDWKLTYQEITDRNTRFALPTPTDNLTATWGFDSTAISNNFYFKTWQFAVQYKYKDSEKSVLSGFSPLYPHPSLVIYPSVTEQIKSENTLTISVPMGGTEVISSYLLVRQDQGLWYIVKEFKKTTATDSPVSYVFTDNTIREYVTADVANLLNQQVPLNAGNIESVKNRVVFGDIKTNYDHPNVSLSLENYPVMVPYTVSDMSFTITDVSDSYRITIDATGMAVFNQDIVNLGFKGDFLRAVDAINDANGFGAIWSFMFNGTYLCTSSNLNDVLEYFTKQINTNGRDLIYKVYVFIGATTVAVTDCVKLVATHTGNTIVITFALTESTYTFDDQYGHQLSLSNQYCFHRPLSFPIDSNNFLGGSGYNVGIEYYDESGNTSGVEAPTSIIIPYDNTIYDSITTLKQYKLNRIRASISGMPPSWAKKYRFVCTKSTSYASVRSFPIGQGYITEYNGQLATAIAMPNTLNYAFVAGDYINMKWRTLSGGASSYFSETGILVLGTASVIAKLRTKTEIVGVNDSTVSGNFLIVDSINAELRMGADFNGFTRTSYGEVVVSIYNPIKTTDLSNQVYFHASPLYDITGICHSEPNTLLLSGDGWMVRDNVSYPIPDTDYVYDPLIITYRLPRANSWDPAFMENTQLGQTVSNANLGKPTISLTDYIPIRVQELWAGGQIIANTQINQLRDFSTLIHLALNESDGIVTGLRMVGDVLKTVQSHHETSVYIGIEKITNADGTMQLVASQGFFGTVNRMADSYGSQHNQSIVSNERDVYYFDLANGCVVRSAPNGSFPISMYDMTSYFKTKAEQINACILNSTTYNIRAYFDRKYREYVLIFDIPGYQESIVFSEKDSQDNEGWFQFVDMTGGGIVPQMFGSVGQTVLSFIGGTLWLHDKTTSYNSLYGENKQLLIRSLVNASPSQEKVLKAIDLDVSEGLNTKITTPITDNNVIGQETVLYAASYKAVQGKLVSKIYQNIRTTGGNDLDQLYVGDNIQGKVIEIDLSLTSNNKVEIRNITVAILPA